MSRLKPTPTPTPEPEAAPPATEPEPSSAQPSPTTDELAASAATDRSMKLRTASESVGHVNSVGPLSVSPTRTASHDPAEPVPSAPVEPLEFTEARQLIYRLEKQGLQGHGLDSDRALMLEAATFLRLLSDSWGLALNADGRVVG